MCCNYLKREHLYAARERVAACQAGDRDRDSIASLVEPIKTLKIHTSGYNGRRSSSGSRSTVLRKKRFVQCMLTGREINAADIFNNFPIITESIVNRKSLFR